MTTETTAVPERRTYGNWVKPQTPGIGRLGTIGTVASLGSLCFALIVQMLAGLLVCAIFVLFVLAFVVAPLLYRNRAGRNGWQVLTQQIMWKLGKRKRQHVYLAGLEGRTAYAGTHRLPGLLAPSKQYEATDAYGQPFGIVHVPATKQYTIAFRVDPEGGELVDRETIDTWVAYYGQFLADIAHEPALVAAAVTVETAPDRGHRLSRAISTILTPDAPQLARDVLTECRETYPRGVADIQAHVALTFSARRSLPGEKELGVDSKNNRVRTPGEMSVLIGGRIPGLQRALSLTGAGSVTPMTARDVAEYVRVAYDPTSADVLEAARADGEDSEITWDNAGPSAAFAAWDYYRHDGGFSVTWQMNRPPRGAVDSNVLADLLAPHPDVHRKRVTMIYRPLDPAVAADVVDSDVRTAAGKVTKRGMAHAGAAFTAAEQTAKEEAAGAGVELFSMLVTGTVLAAEQVPQMRETVDQLGRASRLRLRTCYGSQSAAFAAALGVGVILTDHVNVPRVFRDYL